MIKIKPRTAAAYRLFHQGTEALAEIEHRGITVDTKYLDLAIRDTTAEINTLTDRLKATKTFTKWRRRFGQKTNLWSGDQLATMMYDVLGHKAKYETASHKRAVTEQALEKIPGKFTKLYVEIKKLDKALRTYLLGIRREVCGTLLHPSYNLAGGLEDERKGGAMSYRSSSSDPNFTNMPIRNKKIGKLIRTAFVSRGEDWDLGEVDYSTQEVRVAGCVTGDSVLIDYINNSPPKDMHRDTAALLWGLKPEQIEKKGARDGAKNRFVFPQFYGAYYADCTVDLWEIMKRNDYKIEGTDILLIDHLRQQGITRRGKCDGEGKPEPGTFEYRVKEVEDTFWNEWFVEYTQWKKDWFELYLNTGEVHMPTGFTARGVYRRNQVLNLPIQGPAFHCLLWSIIEVQKEFRRKKMKSMIVGQIHDCMLLDIWRKERQQVLDIVERVMTVDLPKAWDWLIVPLKVEVDIVPKGGSWNDKQPWGRGNDGRWECEA